MPDINREDARYQLAEEAIRGAFLLLCEDMDPEKISVSELSRRAGIVRSAFYHHYDDIFALMQTMENEILQHLETMLMKFNPHGDRDACRTFFRTLCDYTASNAFFSRLLQGEHASIFIGQLLHMLHTYALTARKNLNDQKNAFADPDYAVAYAIGGILGILHKWTQDGCVSSSDEIAVMMTNLFLNGMSEFYV